MPRLDPTTPPIVIAHRGASGYLPEHTLPAKALAYAMGADFLEQDVVLTADDVPVVLHDVHLDTVTNVARRFPGRARDDGRYYAIDFTWAEIQQLQVHERIDLATGRPAFPQRFPLGKSHFSLATLAEEIELIQGLNHSTSRVIGIYPEIKQPAWHRRQGKDISRIVLSLLATYGYRTRRDPAFVQCFDPAETARLRTELGCELRLIQLIGDNCWKESAADYDALRTADGLRRIAAYADGIGPALEHVAAGATPDEARAAPLTSLAHDHGLAVHPYTLRTDALPAWSRDAAHALHVLFDQAGVDGLFADQPDVAARYIVQPLRIK